MAVNSYAISSPVEIVGDGSNPGIIYISNGVNSIELKAPPGLTSDIDFTLPSTIGTTTNFLQRIGPTSTGWVDIIQNNPNSSFPLSIKFNAPSGSPTTVTSSTFTILSSIVYKGTIVDNTILQILGVVETSGNGVGQLQIVDFTNGNIIATSPSFSSTTKIIIDLGIITNLPTTESILEIQLRRVNSTGGGNAALHTIEIYG
jgi:hypothetical protein